MPVNERLMAAGMWDLTLSPDTPKYIRDTVDFFGHIYIFDTPMRPGLSDATMIAASRWGGIVRIKPTPWHIGGVNMIAWLGDEDGKGVLITPAITGPNTLVGYIGNVTSQTTALTAGSLAGLGSFNPTLTITYGGSGVGQTPITPRQMMDNLCQIANLEYRVNKDFTLDAALFGVSALFKTVPTAVAMKRSSGRDQNVVGLSVTQLDVSIDVEEYITGVALQDATGAWTSSNTGVVFFRDLGVDSTGNLSQWTFDVATPTIASNVVTMPISSRMRAGSAAWADNLIADVRMTWRTGAKPMLGIHCDNGSNGIFAFADGANFALVKMVAGVLTTVATVARALVNGTSYWMQIAGVGTTYTVAIYADNTGQRGAQLSSTSGTVAAPTTGQITLNNGTWTIVPTGTCDFGGAFTNVLWLVGPVPYLNGKGFPVSLVKAIPSVLTPAANAAISATNLLLNGPGLRNAVTLTSDEFDIDRDVSVGDALWVYDVDGSMVDTTNPVRYRGSTIYPIEVRVFAMTWPIERGMGVWYRSGAGVWTDITNYVVPEAAGASLEVGAPIRALVKN